MQEFLPDLSRIQQGTRRAVEAQILLRVHAAALRRFGPDQALRLLEEAVDADAHAAGQSFAAQAPDGAPSLKHFATVLERWQAGGMLSLADIRLDADVLEFRVTRCGYLDLYAGLGVPGSLHAILSCRRDRAFAAGYSPRLRMERPETLQAGGSCCRFRFAWTPT